MTAAAERRAAILALPLRPEPLTEEEEAIFQEIEAEVRSGYRGVLQSEFRSTVQQMLHDESE